MKSKAQQGFTLIELLVVVVIIGILASVAVPNFMGAQDKAKNSGVQANTHNVQMALEQYAVDNAGVYPDSETALHSGVVTDKGYMAGGAWPRTPWGMQQAAGIAVPFDVVTQAASAGGSPTSGKAEAAAGTNANPTTATHYGAIAYKVPSDATAKERYTLMGTGKKNNNAVIAIFLKNF
ncbi:MAG: prepilin-type N-terminal cleavage/methylation domain-containing protein [Candidatus Sericytochromatia bacterium]|nr:prepilin-type N-terminal cleavage/methylation domain-containing protein [Candidatus Tanganyikabacteria bacterium]